MANRIKSIANEKAYEAAMQKIDALMKKGENNLTNKEVGALRKLAVAAKAYEKTIYNFPLPTPRRLIGLK